MFFEVFVEVVFAIAIVTVAVVVGINAIYPAAPAVGVAN